MINTVLVEDDLYIQKHFTERLNVDGEFRLVGVYRDAFEAEKHCGSDIGLILMDVQTQHKHSGLAAAERIKKRFRISKSSLSLRSSIRKFWREPKPARRTVYGTRITARRSFWMW